MNRDGVGRDRLETVDEEIYILRKRSARGPANAFALIEGVFRYTAPRDIMDSL